MNFGGLKRISGITLAAGCLFFAQCKKQNDPTVTVDNAVFEVKGNLNGSPFQLAGGEKGYYLFTRYNYSASDSLFSFSGSFEKTGCTNCGEKIDFTLYNAENTGSTGPVNIALALQKDTYAYFDASTILAKEYFLIFKAEDSGYVNPTYSWNFGGGSSADTNQKTAIVKFTDVSPKTICLTITDKTTQCTKTICNTVRPFDVFAGDSLVPDFGYTLNKTIIFRNYSTGDAFTWDFGDGGKSIAYEPEYLYKNKGTYRVCLTTVNKGISRTICKDITYKDANFSCRANFSYNTPTGKITRPKAFSKIKISYTAADGEVFESDVQTQPPSSVFILNSHQAYSSNERSQSTRKLSVSFRCRLYSTTGTAYKDIEVNNGTIAIAFP